MNNFSKIIGWLVFLAGLVLICWTLFSSYNIFTAKAALPEFFQMPEETKAVSQGGSQDMQAQLQEALSQQLKGLVPADFVSKTLNLAVWSILAFILLSGGSKISGLGIKLLKEEKKDERS